MQLRISACLLGFAAWMYADMPTERSGVSDNALPSMRAPRVGNAARQMPEGDLRIGVKFAK